MCTRTNRLQKFDGKGSDGRIVKYEGNQMAQLMATPKITLIARGTVRLLDAPS